MHFRIHMRGSGDVHLSNVTAETGVMGPEVNGICGARLMGEVTTLPLFGSHPYSMCRRCVRMATEQHVTHPYCVEHTAAGVTTYLHFVTKRVADFTASLIEDRDRPVTRHVAVEGEPNVWREVSEFLL